MGSLKGWFRVQDQLITGWAVDELKSAPADVEILLGRQKIAHLSADRLFDPTVGNAGFAFYLDKKLIGQHETVSVVHSSVNTPLKSNHSKITRSVDSDASPLVIEEIVISEHVELRGNVGSYPRKKDLVLEVWSGDTIVGPQIPIEWIKRREGSFRAIVPVDVLPFIWNAPVEIALPGLKEAGLAVSMEQKPIHASVKDRPVGLAIELSCNARLRSPFPIVVAFKDRKQSIEISSEYRDNAALLGWPVDFSVEQTQVEVNVGGAAVPTTRIREIPLKDRDFNNAGRSRDSD